MSKHTEQGIEAAAVGFEVDHKQVECVMLELPHLSAEKQV